MTIQPCLHFEGRCEEAIEFYKKALGAEVTVLMCYKDSPEPPSPGCVPPGSENKVMHACLRIGDATVMAADVAEADRRFTALADGGKVQMPLGKTFFSPCFGMVTDRFGVSWAVVAEA